MKSLVLLAACSSGAPKAPSEPPRRDASPVKDAPPPLPSAYRVETKFDKGDASIRVEWHDVPQIARASSGRTPCGTPRAPAVAPTVLWGIPEVVVMVAVDHGDALPDVGARIVVEPCAMVPRVAIASTNVDVASAAETPVTLEIVKEGDVHQLDTIEPGVVRQVQLPIAGHTVAVPLDPGGVYRLGRGDDPEAAWVIAASQPYTTVTDASGVAILRDVPVGTHPVVAWLPPRAGQQARIARGQVTVVAGGLGETTLDLTAQ